MCIFSRPVTDVSKTSIYARVFEDGRETLIYQMNFAGLEEMAMILPIPVPQNGPEDAVNFVNMKEYPDFFEKLDDNFPKKLAMGRGMSKGLLSAPVAKKPLQVHNVGDFEASFVPEIGAFDRLDDRFKLPMSTWTMLDFYMTWGFVVVKLKPATGRKSKQVHPIAFNFPRRNKMELFYPTVHVHDGEVHSYEEFDHKLYAQGHGLYPSHSWDRTENGYVRTVGMPEHLLDLTGECYRKRMRGSFRNEDVVLNLVAA